MTGVRALRAWGLVAPNSYSPDNRTVLWIGTAVYYVLLTGAVYGLLALRRRGRSILILISPALGGSLGHLEAVQ